MCGIFGIVTDREKTLGPILVEAGRRLSYRGYDSVGCATLSPGGTIDLRKDVGKIDEVAERLRFHEMRGTRGIVQLRWATFGAPSQVNAQPHLDSDGDLVGAHNGNVVNNVELRERFIAEGMTVRSTNDGETCVHAVERYVDQGYPMLEAIRRAYGDLQGDYAFVIGRVGEERLYAFKKGSGLVAGIADGTAVVSSDLPSILPLTRRVLRVEDGEIVVLEPGRVELRRVEDGRPVLREVETVSETLEDAQKGVPPLHAQGDPRAAGAGPGAPPPLRRLASRGGDGLPDEGGAEPVPRGLRDELPRLPPRGGVPGAPGRPAGDPGPRPAVRPPVRPRPGAGGRGAICEPKRGDEGRAPRPRGRRRPGAGAPGAPQRDRLDPDVQKPGLPSPRLRLRDQRSSDEDVHEPGPGLSVPRPADGGHSTEVLWALPDLLERTILSSGLQIGKIVEDLAHQDDLYCLGYGLTYPIALEGALKMKEVTYAHCEGMLSTEFKHGPLSAVHDGYPVIFVCGPEDVPRLVSGINEVTCRGGRAIALGEEDGRLRANAHDLLLLPKAGPLLNPLLAVVPLQLLAYRMSVARGYDPDFPRNLSKTLTVD